MEILSLIAGICGLIFGFYQNKLKQKIERDAKLHASHIYQSAREASGMINDAMKTQDIKTRVELLIRAQAKVNSHYSTTITNFLSLYTDARHESIDDWVEKGFIFENSKNDFKRLIAP